MALHHLNVSELCNPCQSHLHPLKTHDDLIQRTNVRKPTCENVRIDKPISNLRMITIQNGGYDRINATKISPQRDRKRQCQDQRGDMMANNISGGIAS
mmetsp:Transcript_36032/g.52903  ORF Transcript_36032/g.52903 Transcript_36032/m.52903 type:complete len:98 (-) Transcript_36032:356-649(-)